MTMNNLLKYVGAAVLGVIGVASPDFSSDPTTQHAILALAGVISAWLVGHAAGTHAAS